MTDLLILIVITSIALYGSKVTWQNGMIFEKAKNRLDSFFSDYYNDKKHDLLRAIAKPLYACPACMASVWGSAVYLLFTDSTSIHSLVLFDFSCCGLTWILMWQFPFDD